MPTTTSAGRLPSSTGATKRFLIYDVANSCSVRIAMSRVRSGSAAYDERVRLLVTGAAGFIGSNFVHYWLERHPDDQVVAYDLLTYAGNRDNLAGTEAEVPFVHGDIGDLELAEQTLRDHELDTVVNFAAESHNSLAVVDPGLFARTN